MSTAEPTLTLRTDPQWHQAAQVLIDGCAYLPSSSERIRLLEALCDALGPQLYPALIGVLCVVSEHGSAAARKAVADTLVEGLRSGRVPTGRRAAWGSNPSGQSQMAGRSMMRSLGPVEYLCGWYDDPGALQPISASTFDSAMRAMLSLISETDQARQLYCTRLQALAQTPVDGALTRRALEGIQSMADQWLRCGQDFQQPVNAFVKASSASKTVHDVAHRLMGLA